MWGICRLCSAHVHIRGGAVGVGMCVGGHSSDDTKYTCQFVAANYFHGFDAQATTWSIEHHHGYGESPSRPYRTF